MNKLPTKLLLLSGLIVTIIISSNLVSSNIFVSNVYAEEHPPKTSTTTPKRSMSIFKAILSIFKFPENRLITRGDQVCLISPGKLGKQLIWSDHPLFIWQGKTPQSKINLYSAASNYNYQKDEQLIWQKTISPNTQTMAYAGEKLQPGFTYDWEIISHQKTDRPSIILMKESQRDMIAAELTAIENQLQAADATTEEIAIAKADYFIRQKLGSDALQQLYTVQNPSSNLTKQIENIEQYLCQHNLEESNK